MGDEWEEFIVSGDGIPKPEIPPFTIYSSKNSLWGEEVEARAEHGTITDRTIGAVYMAARLAKKPVFFVGGGARKRLNLTPGQLWKGLDRLEKRGVIKTVSTRKGKYRRIQLCLRAQGE